MTEIHTQEDFDNLADKLDMLNKQAPYMSIGFASATIGIVVAILLWMAY